MRRRGHIAGRGKGKWLIKFSADGKQRYAWCKGTRRDAEDKLAQLLTAASTGTLADPSQATVASYTRETLDAGRDLAPKTLERYHEIAEQQIAHIGDVKLQKLRPGHVEKWHAMLLDSGLSARTVNHAHKLLSKVLARAVKHNILTRNVASLVSPPAVEQKEVEVLQPEQVSAVLESLQDHTLFPIVSLALATGMRRGELLALSWGAVALDAPRPFLRVERALEETKATGLRLKAPKTARGRRTSPCPLTQWQCFGLTRLHRCSSVSSSAWVPPSLTHSSSATSKESRSTPTPSAARGGVSVMPRSCHASLSTPYGTPMRRC
jgi:integrase